MRTGSRSTPGPQAEPVSDYKYEEYQSLIANVNKADCVLDARPPPGTSADGPASTVAKGYRQTSA